MISGLSPKERDTRSKIRIGIEKEIKENKFLLFDLEEKMKLKKENDNIKAEKAKLKLFKLNVDNFLKNPTEKLLEFIDINIELMDELPESKQDKLDKAIDKFENKKKQVNKKIEEPNNINKIFDFDIPIKKLSFYKNIVDNLKPINNFKLEDYKKMDISQKLLDKIKNNLLKEKDEKELNNINNRVNIRGFITKYATDGGMGTHINYIDNKGNYKSNVINEKTKDQVYYYNGEKILTDSKAKQYGGYADKTSQIKAYNELIKIIKKDGKNKKWGKPYIIYFEKEIEDLKNEKEKVKKSKKDLTDDELKNLFI